MENVPVLYHPNTVSALFGLCSRRACNACDMMLEFRIRFGRPKTFDVYDDSGRFVGRASARAAGEFLLDPASELLLPDDVNYVESESPEFDAKMLEVALGMLDGDKYPEPKPVADFAGAWRGTNCRHKTISCYAYGGRISMKCWDCPTGLEFTHVGGGEFDVDMTRRGFGPVEYGRHGVDTVIGVVREFVEVLEMPILMADPMSDDPERDARRMHDLALLLVQHGLLRRVETSSNNSTVDWIVGLLSADTCNRRDFVDKAKAISKKASHDGMMFQNGRHVIGTRHALEAFRLWWPQWFAGVGFEIGVYNPAGISKYCVRCYHSTLDDADAEADDWVDGCPECGYEGYLLDLKGWRDGKRVDA